MNRSRRRRFGAIGPIGVDAKTGSRQDSEERSSGFFDRFAGAIGRQVERPWFFAACATSIVVWAITGPPAGFNDTWQLIINTGTTIVTFLLVALLQNTQARTTKAIQHKLDAALTALAEVLDNTDGVDDPGACSRKLRDMVGVQMEGSND